MGGHAGCKGVGLQACNDGGTGTNDESLNKSFLKSELTSEVEGDTVMDDCRAGATVEIGVCPHDILGETFDEPEFVPGIGAQEGDMVCGFGSRTGTGVEFDVGETDWDSDGI